MKEGMAPEIRRIIGLKDDCYYDNALECQNFLYKQKIEAKKEKEPGVKTSECSWVEAIKKYTTMLQEARNNIQRALIGKRPFQLAPEFSHLACSEQQWMEMTSEELRKYLAKFDPFVGIDKLCTKVTKRLRRFPAKTRKYSNGKMWQILKQVQVK